MARLGPIVLVLVAGFFARSYGQEVEVPRDARADAVAAAKTEKVVPVTPKAPPVTQIAKAQPVKEPVVSAPTANAQAPVTAPLKAQAVKTQAVKTQAAKTQPAITQAMKTQPLKVAMVKTEPALTSTNSQPVALSSESAFTKLADGFDFPVGKPDAQRYYKARGFREKGHLGEDWDGVGGGDTDLGDPIYCIGDGIVVFARDCHQGWGNVMIVRHAYRENGDIKYIDSLYGHLNSMLAHRGQTVTRGQEIATMGTAHGLYDAHLHLEIRKNLEIGMSRAKFARDFNNYYDPSRFISSHRTLQTSREKFRVAMNTFKYDSRINWASKRNYSSYRGGSGESAAALKRALASQSGGSH
jgi:murein DD-endopeptidase MepM/ murein hydrolase activator NlpD